MDNIEIPPAGEDAARSKRILFYTLEKKHKIVQEAFSQPNLVCATARKWRVQPNQIRKWRQNIMHHPPRQEQTLCACLHLCWRRGAGAEKKNMFQRVHGSGECAVTSFTVVP